MPSHLHTNRLIDTTSPYLLQHAHNPVDWHPWGEEAHARARQENKPIFLSIGYSACHWCHVMEREVFENAEIAAVMNEHFINIKVDREERPDLDDLYMLATQLMSGSGGWPMSVWLTPDLRPFYAGTYFPPVDGHGRPGFPRLATALADSWKYRRGELEAQAEKVVEAIRMHADETGSGTAAREREGDLELPLGNWLSLAVEQMADRFDDVNGGLGSAPKFPPHQALALWLGLLSSGHKASSADQAALRNMVTRTLDGMMHGGIYDHIGGAFARYSTDDKWLVPHFEKMLYDSAQLAPVYAAAGMLLNRADYARVARETLDFFLREMKSRQDGFFSALDADSQGHEGMYYVWTLADVHAALPENGDAALVTRHFGMKKEGNWHESPVEGGNVLATSGEEAEDRGRLQTCLVRMREFRSRRERPFLDDKILTAWNGLMISALAACGRLLGEPAYVDAAQRALDFLLMHHMQNKQLLRVSREGKSHILGFLDDYAFILNGLMDLIHGVKPDHIAEMTALATELADTMIRDFQDEAAGGFFYTTSRHEKLFVRMKNAADNATPSANGVAIRGLFRLARVTGKDIYRETALRAVAAFAVNIERRPEWFPTILLALAEDTDPGKAVAASPLHEAKNSDILQITVDEPSPQHPGENFDLQARITIVPGYHIQPHRLSQISFAPTVAHIRGDLDLARQEWEYPPAGVVGETQIPGYTDTVRLTARCQLPAEAKPGHYAMRLTVNAQPCTEIACLAAQSVTTSFSLTVT